MSVIWRFFAARKARALDRILPEPGKVSTKIGANGQDTPRPLILIVASHELVREVLREWLSVKFSDCRCVTTSTGEEALAIACAEGPDVVIVELDVPDSGGAETLRTIRRACPRSHLVVLSEHAEEVNRISAESESVGSFVCKQKIDAELPPLIRTILADRIGRGVSTLLFKGHS